MRQKHRQLIITFSTTTQALRVEKFCQENGICGRMIPVPGEIKAGCGLAWKTEPQEQEHIAGKLQQAGMEWETMTVMELYKEEKRCINYCKRCRGSGNRNDSQALGGRLSCACVRG